MGKGSRGGNRKSEVRNMQVLATRQDAGIDAGAAAGAVSASAAVGVPASAELVQEARAGKREGGDGEACLARVYVAGPMTGYPNLNFPAFHAAAASLRARGYEVINPAELVPDQSAKWEDCMRKDIAALVTCDRIAMLEGWEKSRGATIEARLAADLGIKRISLEAAL